MNFGSKLNKVKQQADRLFLRGDKTDVFGELREAEEKADELRILTEAFYRSSEKRLYTYHATDEKKHKKVPENQVADSLKDALKEAFLTQTSEVPDKNLFRGVVEEIVGTELLLGKIVLDYEEQIESQVLQPIHKLLKEDFPSVAKQKKALKQAGQDVDAAKARFRNSVSNPGQAAKAETLKCDLEEAEARLETIRDSYACDLFNTLGRQREIAKLTCLSVEMKLDFLQKALSNLTAQLPPLRHVLEESMSGPVYAVPLHEHLRISHRELAFPIEECVQRLVQYGMKEEGLFRVAGSTNKVKRLKGAFDSGMILPGSLSSPEHVRDYDIHVVAGALKCYLRDLPEPLLTHMRHDQWVEAIRTSNHDDKLKAMWQVVQSLPAPNLKQLAYIMKFLALLATYSSDNKMTWNNLAIVIAPNLIWCQKECDDTSIDSFGVNMTLSNDYRNITEQLIQFSDYFFEEKINFNCSVPVSSPRPHTKLSSNGGLSPGSSATLGRISNHKRSGSSDLHMNTSIGDFDAGDSPKQPHRTKKKPAPKPPNKSSTDADEMSTSTNSLRSSPEPSRGQSPSGNQPLPAPRLYHANSIKRPTVNPPRPPTQIARPPRPDPPASQETPPSTNSSIGAEKASTHANSTSDSGGDSDNVFSESSLNETKEEEVELREHPTGTSDEFRKSLEGVLKHPHTLPRHFTRPSSGDSSAYQSSEEKNAVPLPGFPVPAQRTSKEIEKAVKPNIAEKPVKVGKNESSKPVVPDKPTSLAGKPGAQKPMEGESPVRDDHEDFVVRHPSETGKLYPELSFKVKTTDSFKENKSSNSDSTQL